MFFIRLAAKNHALNINVPWGSVFTPLFSHCMISLRLCHSFSWLPLPPIHYWLPNLDLEIRLFCEAPNLDIQSCYWKVPSKWSRGNSNTKVILPHKLGPLHVWPAWVDGWSHQDKKLKPSSTSPLPVPPRIPPFLISEGILCSTFAASLEVCPLCQLEFISCHHSQ